MTATIFDQMKQSRNPFTVAALRAIATSDMMFSLMPFVPKGGDSFTYTREKAIGSFHFIPDTGATIQQSTGSVENITVAKRQAAEDFYVDHFAEDNQSESISPMEQQTLMKLKVAGRTLADKVINGGHTTGFTMDAFQGGAYIDTLVAASAHLDTVRRGPGSIKYTNAGTLIQFRAPGDRAYGPAVAAAADGTYLVKSDNPSLWIKVTLDVSDASADAERLIYFTSTTDEFDGLESLISLSQVRSAVGANGDAASFAILDELMHAVKVKSNLAFVMNNSLIMKYRSQLRALGGTDPFTLPNTAIEVPTYGGIPMLTNDFIPSDEAKGNATNLSSIYLVSLDETEGMYMGALGGKAFNVEADPRNAAVLGFRLIDLGTIQDPTKGNVFGRRLVWYGGLALGSDLAAARAQHIITT